jgi:hypothetical protein
VQVDKITVCGGGNGAQTLAPIAARNLGCAVDLYAPFADEAQRLRDGVTANGGLEACGAVQAKARPRQISAAAAEVIPGSAVVVLVLPAFAHEATLRQIAPYLDEGAWVGAMPARGGFDFCAVQVLRGQGREDVHVFGLQTLPWACRIDTYGQVVYVLGTKGVVDAASRPAARIAEITPLLQTMLGVRTGQAANLLGLTLANTGQLIHPGIMYGLFSDWDGTPLAAEEVPLFYHGLSQEGASILAALSDDIQAIRARLEPELDLAAVRPLLDWLLMSYGDAIAVPDSLHSAFTSNRAYTGLKAPVREIEGGQLVPGIGPECGARYVPDFRARYLAEDVPFGLAVSRAIGQLAGVEIPATDEVIEWAGVRLGKDYSGRNAGEVRSPQAYGLQTMEQLVAFAREEAAV